MKKELINRLNKSLNELISDLLNNNDYKKIIECIGKKEDLKLYDLSYELYDNEEYKNLTDKEKIIYLIFFVMMDIEFLMNGYKKKNYILTLNMLVIHQHFL